MKTQESTFSTISQQLVSLAQRSAKHLVVVCVVCVFAAMSQAAPIIIDNGDFGSGYAVSGITEQGSTADAWDDDQAYNSVSGNQSANATYTFTGLASGIYDVYASWRLNGQGNTQFMQVAVSDGGPTVLFNQTNIGPNADLTLNDGGNDINFEIVGQVTITDGDVVVTNSLGGGNFFITDAVAIEFAESLPTPEPSTFVLATLGLVGLVGTRRRRRNNRHTYGRFV